MLFRQEKSGFKKVPKNRTFPKGLVHGFWQKMAFFFHWWYLGKSSQKRSSFVILDRTEWFLDKKSQVFCFFVKNGHFSHWFLGTFSQKTWHFYILDKKECFLDKKSQVLKKSKKIQIFQRG